MISLTCDSLFRRLVSRLRLHCPRCGSRVINNNCTASCLDHGLLLLAGHPVILTAINGHVLSTLYFIHLSLGSHQKISLCWITAFCYFASCSDLLALKLLNTHRLGDRPAGYMLNWLSSDRNVLRVLHVYLCLCKFWNLLLLLVINARAAYPVFLSFCSIRLLITICVWHYVFVCLNLLFEILKLLLDVILACVLLDSNCICDRTKRSASNSVHLM